MAGRHARGSSDKDEASPCSLLQVQAKGARIENYMFSCHELRGAIGTPPRGREREPRRRFDSFTLSSMRWEWLDRERASERASVVM